MSIGESHISGFDWVGHDQTSGICDGLVDISASQSHGTNLSAVEGSVSSRVSARESDCVCSLSDTGNPGGGKGGCWENVEFGSRACCADTDIAGRIYIHMRYVISL